MRALGMAPRPSGDPSRLEVAISLALLLGILAVAIYVPAAAVLAGDYLEAATFVLGAGMNVVAAYFLLRL